jgi:hypothetical protein
MTDKTFIFKFVVATTVAITLGISVVKYFFFPDQVRTNRSIASQTAELPNPQLSRVRLLVSTMK